MLFRIIGVLKQINWIMSCSKQQIPSSHFSSSIFQKKVQCNGQDAFKSKPEPDMFQKVQYSRQSLSCKWCSSTQWYVMEERENLFSENKRTSHHWYWTWHIYLFVFKAHIRQIWLLPKSSISDEQQKFRENICLTIWTTFHCRFIALRRTSEDLIEWMFWKEHVQNV